MRASSGKKFTLGFHGNVLVAKRVISFERLCVITDGPNRGKDSPKTLVRVTTTSN